VSTFFTATPVSDGFIPLIFLILNKFISTAWNLQFLLRAGRSSEEAQQMVWKASQSALHTPVLLARCLQPQGDCNQQHGFT
jgi:hypothetical protein